MLKHYVLFSILCLMVFVVSPCHAKPSTQKFNLDNGLTVLLTPMSSGEVVSIYALVKTGAATEGRLLGSGISHFIEHMLFKGTQRRSVGQIAKEVKSLGGTINASTDLDYTIYTLDVPKDKLKAGIDIISDMLKNSVFDTNEVEKERKVIHGEMRLYYDKPQRRLSVDVFKNVYKRHPYRHPTIGYENLFDALTRDDLFMFYQRNYIPNNMVVSIAGNIDPEATLALAQQHFADHKPKPYVSRNLLPEPPQLAERYFEEYYQTPLFWFSMAYQGVPLIDQDMFAMDLLSMAIGRGEGGRLYKELYHDKKLVVSISSSNYTPYDKGIFEIEGKMEVDNLNQVRLAVIKIIDDIKRHGLRPDELEKAKVKVAADYIYDNQTSSSIAYRTALEEAMLGDPDFSKDYVDMIAKVTNADIKKVANKYLSSKMLSITVVKPLSTKIKEQAKQKIDLSSSVQSFTLPNGLRILLKEDHGVKLVSVQAVLNGGLRSENKDNNGISQLFSSVWTKATKQRSESSIIKLVESKAMTFSAYSGYNALGISMQFLSKDIDTGLNLLFNTIKNPKFDVAALDRQRNNLKVAIDTRNDDIRAFAFREVMALLYEKHPNRMDVLGSKETLSNISSHDIEKYFNEHVSPSNLVISIFGDIDSKHVKDLLIKELGGMTQHAVVIPTIKEPNLTTARVKNIKLDKEQAVVAMAFLAPSIKGEDRFAMEMVNASLGAGLSGRLFVKVRDQLGRAYTVGSTYMPGYDTGNIVLYCLTTNSKVDGVTEIMRKEIDDLGKNLLTDEEFNSVKAYLKGGHQMSLNTVGVQAARSAFNTLYGLGHDFDDQYNSKIDAITKEQFKATVNQYLTPSQAAIVTAMGQEHGQ